MCGGAFLLLLRLPYDLPIYTKKHEADMNLEENRIKENAKPKDKYSGILRFWQIKFVYFTKHQLWSDYVRCADVCNAFCKNKYFFNG